MRLGNLFSVDFALNFDLVAKKILKSLCTYRNEDFPLPGVDLCFESVVLLPLRLRHSVPVLGSVDFQQVLEQRLVLLPWKTKSSSYIIYSTGVGVKCNATQSGQIKSILKLTQWSGLWSGGKALWRRAQQASSCLWPGGGSTAHNGQVSGSGWRNDWQRKQIKTKNCAPAGQCRIWFWREFSNAKKRRAHDCCVKSKLRNVKKKNK